MKLTPTKIQELAEYWQKSDDFIQYNHKLLNIYEGQLKKYLEEAIRLEFEDEQQQKELIQRVPTLNVLRSLVDKLSKVYVQPVIRRTDPAYQAVFDTLLNLIDLDSVMCVVDEMLNLHKACFIEFFTDNGKVHVRAVPIDRAIPYSDNPVNPLRPTATLKLIGRETLKKTDGSYTDVDGILNESDRETVEILLVHTDDFSTVIASGGELPPSIIRKYLDSDIVQNDYGVWGVPNDFGRIPMVYINKSKFSLLPKPDNDLYDMTILLPKLLADLNYAVKYASSSMYLAIDLDIKSGTKKRPSSILSVETKKGSTTPGKFDVVKPAVDINPVLSLIQAQLIMWLESRGLKSGSAGKASEQRASSLAKIIDSADATAQRLATIKLLTPVEKEIISALVSYYRFAKIDSILDDPLDIPDSLTLTSIEYSDQRPILSNDDAQKKAEFLWSNQLGTAEQVIKTLNPGWSDTMVREWVAKLPSDPKGVLSELKKTVTRNSEEPAQKE
jgi:hypothetical protein